MSRDCGRDLVDERKEVAVDLDQALAVALPEAERRRANQFPKCTPLTEFHARNRLRVGYREFIAIPEPHGNIGVADRLHDPANQGAIEIALHGSVSAAYPHGTHLSAEICFLSLYATPIPAHARSNT